MANVDLTYINAALTRTGSNPISSLDDTLFGAQLASSNYEVLVRTELSVGRWKFATKFEVLSLLDEDVEGTPPDPWQFGYQLPTDLIDLRTIKSYGIAVEYERMGSKIFCNLDDTVEVVAVYVWRVAEADWPPWFAEAITQRLEAMFLRGRERHEEAAERDKSVLRAMSAARTADAQSQTPRDPNIYPTLVARRA